MSSTQWGAAAVAFATGSTVFFLLMGLMAVQPQYSFHALRRLERLGRGGGRPVPGSTGPEESGGRWSGRALRRRDSLARLAGRFLARRRVAVFEEQLEPAVQSLIASLRAGQTLVQALETAATESREPLAGEFRQLLREYAAGIPLLVSFRRLARRMQGVEVSYLLQAIEIHNISGGNLTAILSRLVEGIKERQYLRGELRARTAEARLTSVVLILMPPALALFLHYYQGWMLTFLLKHPLGQLGVIYAAVSWVTGAAVVKYLLDTGEPG